MKLIICTTKDGNTARLLAKYRPDVPVLCLCLSAKVGRQLQLVRGCHPVVMKHASEPEHIAKAVSVGKQLGFCSAGDDVVLINSEAGSSSQGIALGTTPTVRIVEVTDA